MAEEKESSKIPVAADFASIQARIAIALAARENLVKSWTARSIAPKPPPKTAEEIEAERAEVYASQPKAGIPKPGSGAVRTRQDLGGNDRLRGAMGLKRGHQGIKSREDGSARNGKVRKREESSDEEEGRSGLGKGKRSKSIKVVEKAAVNPAALAAQNAQENSSTNIVPSMQGSAPLEKEQPPVQPHDLAIRPIKLKDAMEAMGKAVKEEDSEEETTVDKAVVNISMSPDPDRKKAKLREKKRRQKLMKKQREKEAKAAQAG